MKIYIDANFFISLNNIIDTNHTKAKNLSQKLFETTDVRFTISNLTFLEVVTVISQRVDRQTAHDTGNDLLRSEHVEIIHISEELQQKAWQIFQDSNKKNLSFVDCSILAVMRYEDIDTLLTFDQKDFGPLQQYYNFHLFPLT